MQKTDDVNAAGFNQSKNTNGNTDAETCCAPSCCGTETRTNEVKSAEEIKRSVNEKYSKIALASESGSCCGTSCCESDAGDYSIMNDEYQSLDGYVPDADMGLGCGLPTEYAGIKAGDTVLDLGSGAGNDVYVARKIAGDTGRVIGVDMSEAMIAKANAIKAKYGFTNVEFRLGDIENLPVEDNTADVVVSNCVLNLVPDKTKAFAEVYRVLKPGAHFSVSDIVVQGIMSAELQESAAMYAGCISGALQKEEYMAIIEQTGFKDVEIKKSRRIELPEVMLEKYLSQKAVEDYHKNIQGIFSITVNGYKH